MSEIKCRICNKQIDKSQAIQIKHGNAFANPHMEIKEEDIAMGYKDAGDEIVKAWNDFDDYLKRHPDIWQSLADKLWDGFVDYKDIPFGNKEI